jgi:hypothetical protein
MDAFDDYGDLPDLTSTPHGEDDGLPALSLIKKRSFAQFASQARARSRTHTLAHAHACMHARTHEAHSPLGLAGGSREEARRRGLGRRRRAAPRPQAGDAASRAAQAAEAGAAAGNARHAHARAHARTRIHSHSNARSRARTHTHKHALARAHARAHTRAHAHTHTLPHTLRHTHAHARQQESSRDETGGADAEFEDPYYADVKAAKKQRKEQKEVAYSRERPQYAPEDALDDGEKRTISREIEKNKGLTPHRKKEMRNPRVRHRKAALKKDIKRRTGQGIKDGIVQKPTNYGGESTGIKANVKRSQKLSL